MKLYYYPKCSTCKAAIKLLNSLKVEPKLIDLTEQAPSKTELRQMLRHQGNKVGALFNTSGKQYRELGMKERLPQMSVDDALSLLSKNGMLVKRPFLLGKEFGLVGFKEVIWRKALRP